MERLLCKVLSSSPRLLHQTNKQKKTPFVYTKALNVWITDHHMGC
jgi:hypothetical protein